MQISKKAINIEPTKLIELEEKIKFLESQLSTMQKKVDTQLVTKLELQSEMIKQSAIETKEVL